MSGHLGSFEPVVVAPIEELHGQRHQLFVADAVENRDHDADEVAAQFGQVAFAVEAHAAVLAEEMAIDALGGEAIVAQLRRIAEQLEGFGLDEHDPVAHFDAEGAVAFAGSGFQIDVGLKADFLAVAAALVSFEWHSHGLGESKFRTSFQAFLGGFC